MRTENTDGMLTIFLEGEIDAQNAPTVKKEIDACLEGRSDLPLAFDAKDLSYISSAGLKILLALQKKTGKRISIVGLRPEVLEIFKMAGFHMLMDIKDS